MQAWAPLSPNNDSSKEDAPSTTCRGLKPGPLFTKDSSFDGAAHPVTVADGLLDGAEALQHTQPGQDGGHSYRLPR
jgi:hypothetical protein